QHNVLAQGRLTLLLNIAHRRAHLGVIVGLDVFKQEIDQPALTLQQSQEAKRLGGRLLFFLLFFHITQKNPHTVGQRLIRDNAPFGLEQEEQAANAESTFDQAEKKD